MKWLQPPITKIYEALGSIADGRIEISGNTAKVYSSSRNKYYDVTYDPETKSIMANDNASYWNGYLGYPSICFLMKAGIISYDSSLALILKGISWKDINQKFKNDFEKALAYILESKTEDERKQLELYVNKASEEIKNLDLNILGKRQLPPKGY